MSEYNIKLVGLDIDGTLLNSKNHTSSATRMGTGWRSSPKKRNTAILLP